MKNYLSTILYKLTFLGIAIFGLNNVQATTYFVDAKHGNDVENNGQSVDNSWSTANPFKSLQKALDVVEFGDEIWVKAGTYIPTKRIDVDSSGVAESREATFQLVDGVAIYGGFKGVETAKEQRNLQGNPSILSGEIGIPAYLEDNVYHVVYSEGLSDATILDGFTIQDGKANKDTLVFAYENSVKNSFGSGLINIESTLRVNNCIFQHNEAIWGSGIANLLSGHTIIVNATFKNNKVYSSGGAIANFEGKVTVEKSRFLANQGYGGSAILNRLDGILQVNDCLFKDNTSSFGGAIINLTSLSSTITNSTFINNHSLVLGGAIYIRSAGNVKVVNCLFNGNTSDGSAGAIFNNESKPKIINSVFINNKANGEGGAIFNVVHSYPSVINCTFNKNEAAAHGGGMCHTSDAGSEIKNSIFWDNTDQSGKNSFYKAGHINTPFVSYTSIEENSCPQRVSCEEGMIYGQDPLFTSADDLSLQTCSPVINQGNTNILPLDSTDVDGDGLILEYLPIDVAGNERNIHQNVDMGAYEYSEALPESVFLCPSNVVSNSEDIIIGQPIVSYECGVESISNSFNNTDNASGTYPMGTTDVQWTAHTSDGKTMTCSTNVTVEESVGIDQMNGAETSVHVYPNPLTTEATISFSVKETQVVTVEIFDITGKKIQQVWQQNLVANQVQKLDFQKGKLAKGVYILKVAGHKGFVQQQKIIIE